MTELKYLKTIDDRDVDQGELGVLTPEICRTVGVCFDSPSPKKNVTFFHSKLLLDNCNFHIINDDILVSKMERKTNFSRRLKQFDGLT